ncbi:MAG TPA: universal stress protein [Thermoleophilia bacterium]|nr:universal stress protein [Thermoleophilia bacterium]
MTHPIVLGYDGSACSSAALDEAIELGRDARGAKVILVCCHEPPAGLSCPFDPTGADPRQVRDYQRSAYAKELRDYERRVETEVEPMLRLAAERIRDAGIEAEVELVWDDPVRALDAIAHERGSRVIVVGSHGEGPIAGALSRHTAFELLYKSDVPVLVVPLRDHHRRRH